MSIFRAALVAVLAIGCALRTAGGRAQNDSPSIFIALEQQLGLKLETRKEPFDVMVIDRVTLPTDN